MNHAKITSCRQELVNILPVHSEAFKPAPTFQGAHRLFPSAKKQNEEEGTKQKNTHFKFVVTSNKFTTVKCVLHMLLVPNIYDLQYDCVNLY